MKATWLDTINAKVIETPKVKSKLRHEMISHFQVTVKSGVLKL